MTSRIAFIIIITGFLIILITDFIRYIREKKKKYLIMLISMLFVIPIFICMIVNYENWKIYLAFMYVLLGIYLFSLYFVDRKEINKEYHISFFSKTSTVIFLIIFISLLIPFMVIAYHMEAYNTLFHILTFFVILVLYFIVFQIKKKKNK